MKILILDGHPEQINSSYENYLQDLTTRLKKERHSVSKIIIRTKSIKFCTGCWRCWVKNPGECFVKDDSHFICREVIHSDFVLFVSPVMMGFTSAVLKKAQDKLIPLLHPYIEIVNNESHHRKRYTTYPKLGLLLDKSKDTDEEDINIITDVYKRLALNFKSNLYFSEIMNNNIKEVCHAINNL